MANHKVSLPVIKRLPRYYRYISMLKKNGTATVSSSELAGMMRTTASQVRQDFNCFGGFGQQGIGYSVDSLCNELETLLFGDPVLDTILIGTGRLGRAITGFLSEDTRGYRLVGAFDKSPTEIGKPLGDLTIQSIDHLADFCKDSAPHVAVLCVPSKGAVELAPQLLDLGIKGFWNFSHYDLSSTSPDVVVENVHLSDSLISLGYRVRHTGD